MNRDESSAFEHLGSAQQTIITHKKSDKQWMIILDHLTSSVNLPSVDRVGGGPTKWTMNNAQPLLVFLDDRFVI